MNLVISILQPGKKPKKISSPIVLGSEKTSQFIDTCRKLFEVETTLNSLPGTNLRFHISLEDKVNDAIQTERD